ncbi:uncharacterized protein [Venturia canescens]|uniref:uncharacterized protein n=1 Tax=Venturia canescens TaxID=32260 RepID=UPI001C9BF002|nr:uncharacterized protein LOC122417893 [Venturia canescens]XP_043288331.1 uncharacterized protein LOC122418261 [Venturia canescens]
MGTKIIIDKPGENRMRSLSSDFFLEDRAGNANERFFVRRMDSTILKNVDAISRGRFNSYIACDDQCTHHGSLLRALFFSWFNRNVHSIVILFPSTDPQVQKRFKPQENRMRCLSNDFFLDLDAISKGCFNSDAVYDDHCTYLGSLLQELFFSWFDRNVHSIVSLSPSTDSQVQKRFKLQENIKWAVFRVIFFWRAEQIMRIRSSSFEQITVLS